uniref:Uncharacterized protein n=1 Tax=uncultured marine virus TaxID=186617 RepID=A0A0F7L963_9VIRU|nr:hypothetical protein [uncultured marine virus]
MRGCLPRGCSRAGWGVEVGSSGTHGQRLRCQHGRRRRANGVCRCGHKHRGLVVAPLAVQLLSERGCLSEAVAAHREELLDGLVGLRPVRVVSAAHADPEARPVAHVGSVSDDSGALGAGLGVPVQRDGAERRLRVVARLVGFGHQDLDLLVGRVAHGLCSSAGCLLHQQSPLSRTVGGCRREGGLGPDEPPPVALEDGAGAEEVADDASVKLADARTLEGSGALAGTLGGEVVEDFGCCGVDVAHFRSLLGGVFVVPSSALFIHHTELSARGIGKIMKEGNGRRGPMPRGRSQPHAVLPTGHPRP